MRASIVHKVTRARPNFSPLALTFEYYRKITISRHVTIVLMRWQSSNLQIRPTIVAMNFDVAICHEHRNTFRDRRARRGSLCTLDACTLIHNSVYRSKNGARPTSTACETKVEPRERERRRYHQPTARVCYIRSLRLHSGSTGMRVDWSKSRRRSVVARGKCTHIKASLADYCDSPRKHQ